MPLRSTSSLPVKLMNSCTLDLHNSRTEYTRTRNTLNAPLVEGERFEVESAAQTTHRTTAIFVVDQQRVQLHRRLQEQLVSQVAEENATLNEIMEEMTGERSTGNDEAGMRMIDMYPFIEQG